MYVRGAGVSVDSASAVRLRAKACKLGQSESCIKPAAT
jgi:hypothetical protein